MSKANVDESTVLGGRVRLLQMDAGLRAGLDAVMVAAACPASAGDGVLDLGCGTGAAGLCVRARVEVTLTGLDIQPELIDLARQSAQLNGWDASFICGDLRDKSLLPADAFDHAVCNPPYNQPGQWYDTPDAVRSKQLGKKEGDAMLMDWIDCLQRVIRPHGSLAMIHRADHADRIIQALGTRFGALELWPLHPHKGEIASRLVIRALKNRKTPVKMYPGIVLHEMGGGWTQGVDDILTHGKPLISLS